MIHTEFSGKWHSSDRKNGTTATETILNHWHYITEMTGSTWPKWVAQWRPNYPDTTVKWFGDYGMVHIVEDNHIIMRKSLKEKKQIE